MRIDARSTQNSNQKQKRGFSDICCLYLTLHAQRYVKNEQDMCAYQTQVEIIAREY